MNKLEGGSVRASVVGLLKKKPCFSFCGFPYLYGDEERGRFNRKSGTLVRIKLKSQDPDPGLNVITTDPHP